MPTPIWQPCENYTAGRDGTSIDRIVIHYIVGTLAAADVTFADPNSGVSAHYGIGEGSFHQYVSEINTAWHAGNWSMNQRSIGIEHSADPDRRPTLNTYDISIELCTRICREYGIDPQTQIIPHSSVAATACPGTVNLQHIRDEVERSL
ncbi:N-acetylmuramoyl-L-alanine amidase [Nesterenkonia lacusekhoensis]|uniref:N-acetylmuramoyl-L-alanine amidase n=1 Tax=Nesterenkonia lacusekhoensis TaxID=150832 RepID=A0ABS4T306_9MICC|nr:N-acetylmuramoyl-L-alanine amidase [Nesterenkonia lacusekhoensis]MBP2317666.1 N-acetyl-anhydromuramyl-L-alanine amidase AmpD [Nesterenkonia lacusekhoensis]